MGLLVNGKFTPASEVLNRFFVENGVIYSIENGVRKRWMYNQQGLVCFNPHSWLCPIPYYKLSSPPGEYKVQFVTSYKNPSDHSFLDKAFKGAVHSWLRLVTPEGDVYSMGWGCNPKEFNPLQPCATVGGIVFCPDPYEVVSQNRLETTIPISEQQAESLLEFIAISAYDDEAKYNFFSGNCVEFASQALEYANIAKLPNRKITIPEIICKIIIPKRFRKLISSFTSKIPTFFKAIISFPLKLCFSLVLMPFVLLLGAWKLNPLKRQPIANLVSDQQKPIIDINTPEIIKRVFGKKIQQLQEQAAEIKRSNFKRGVFRSFFDIINPKSYEITFHAKLKKWQLSQGGQMVHASF